jgi:transcriptional regulator with XRE-family HTH domain
MAENTHPLARRIKEAIDRSGMHQYELARRAGTSPSAVSEILNGKRNMSLGLCERLCRAAGCEMSIHHIIRRRKVAEPATT